MCDPLTLPESASDATTSLPQSCRLEEITCACGLPAGVPWTLTMCARSFTLDISTRPHSGQMRSGLIGLSGAFVSCAQDHEDTDACQCKSCYVPHRHLAVAKPSQSSVSCVAALCRDASIAITKEKGRMHVQCKDRS